MLRFTSYFPMASFLKIELEFGDEKITQKFKSLTGEGENEIPYSKIAHIQFHKWADMRWAMAGAVIAVITYILVTTFFIYLPEIRGNPVVLGIGKIFFLLGLALCIPGFIKRDVCFFYDKDLQYITVIAITDKNLEDVFEAIEFVKTKTTIVSETYPDLLDEEKDPKFEHVVYFPPNYLYKNITLFYDDKILDIEKSLIRENATEYQYSDLTQKILIEKSGDQGWDSLFSLLWCIVLPLSTGLPLFFSDTDLGIKSLLLVGGFSLIPFLMRYIKNEIVVFYDKDDDVVLTIKIPRGGKQEVEEIIQFVKTKISETSGA